MANLFIALESSSKLEINKLLEEEKDNNKGSRYDELYIDLKKDKFVEILEDEEDDVIDTDLDGDYTEDPGGDIGDGSSDLSPENEDVDASNDQTSPSGVGELDGGGGDQEKSEDKKEGGVTRPEESTALESHPLALQILNYEQTVANESALVSGARKILGLTVDVVASITSLGIEYTPKLASSITKGLAFIISRTAKLLYVGHSKITEYLNERERSLDKLSRDIDSLKKSLSLIEENSKDDDGTRAEKEDSARAANFNDVRVIDALKIGADVDFQKNIDKLTRFLSTTIKDLGKYSSIEYRTLERLAEPNNMFIVPTSKELLSVGIRNVLSAGSRKGYEAKSDDVDALSSRELLPGDVRLMAYVPSTALVDLDEIKSAYKVSKTFLGFDVDNYVEVEQIDYMDIKGVSKFLDSLENLINLSRQHHNYYMTVRKNKEKLRGGLKNFLLGISQGEKKYGENDTMIKAFHIKLEAIDRLYLSGAMDLHKYIGDTVSKASVFAAENIRHLS